MEEGEKKVSETKRERPETVTVDVPEGVWRLAEFYWKHMWGEDMTEKELKEFIEGELVRKMVADLESGVEAENVLRAFDLDPEEYL